MTNFKWDYAEIWAEEDIQNIWFYKDRDVVFTDGIDLDGDGLFKSQVIFSPKAYCFYNNGKVVFDEKVKLNINNGRTIYYYKPVDCILHKK